MFGIAPSEFRRRFTARDLLEVAAYFQLKKEFDGKAPPLPDEENPLIVRAMEAKKQGVKVTWLADPLAPPLKLGRARPPKRLPVKAHG